MSPPRRGSEEEEQGRSERPSSQPAQDAGPTLLPSPLPGPGAPTSCMRLSWGLRVSRRPLARTAGSSCHNVLRGPGGRAKVGASPGFVEEGTPSSLTPHSSSDSTAAR